MEEVHWYCIGAEDSQQGPFFLSEIKDMLKDQRITTETFVWHEELDGWDRLSNVSFRGISALEHIRTSLLQAVPSITRLEVAPPVSSRLSKNFIREESKELEDKVTASKELENKDLESMDPESVDSESSRKSLVSGWSQEETEEGLVYYSNLLTGEVRFTAPRSTWQVFFEKECIWIPDSVEGYYPATLHQRIGLNERLKVQRFGKQNVTELVGKAVEGSLPLDRESYHTLKHVRFT